MRALSVNIRAVTSKVRAAVGISFLCEVLKE